MSGLDNDERSLWPEMRKWVKDIKTKDKVLDVGCGEGRLLQELDPKVDYTGIDFSKGQIKKARKKYKGKNRKFVIGDINKKSAWKGLGKFDKIFAIAVIHHIPTKKEQLKVFNILKGHLKSGGRVYLSFWNLWQKKYWREHLRCLVWKIANLPDGLRWVMIPFRSSNIRRFYFAGEKRYWNSLINQTGWNRVKMNFDNSKKNIWAILD